MNEFKKLLHNFVDRYKRYIFRRNNLKKNIKADDTCTFAYNSMIRDAEFEGRNFVNSKAEIVHSQIGFGTYIAQNSIIINSKIGRYSAVGYESLIGGHPLHEVASIHPALYSTQGQYGFTYVDEDAYKEYHYVDETNKWSIVIGNDVWVTAGSTKIIQGVTIGDGAVVLADAVVTKNVLPYAIVGGVPAKVVDYRFTPEQIDFLLKLRWWDRNEHWIKDHAKYFKSIDLLMKVVAEEENKAT
jgi:acetyltransferase-like isoleucine patch superfamily enzyme